MSLSRRNHVCVALHLVWHTYQRLPMIAPSREEALYRCIASEIEKANAQILAVNGMPDHVHVLLLLPTTISIAKLVQQMKGVSSSLARDLWPGSYFRWAEGYGAFSVSRGHIKRVAAYIQRQKAHHASGKLWMLLETPDMPDETPAPQSPNTSAGHRGEALTPTVHRRGTPDPDGPSSRDTLQSC